jgi:hypothetical protein
VVHQSRCAAAPRRDLHDLRPGGRRQQRALPDGAGRPHPHHPPLRRRLALALRALALALAAGALGAPAAEAQFYAFGQNKIQYRRFDWHVLKGAHVDLYYYPAEADLAPAALAYAEASYDTLALQFGHEMRARVPLIVYASHVDFEQTNLLPFTPPEGLLGFTEFLKRRVALPFRGNFAEFRHTLRHELVHAFQLSLSSDGYYQSVSGSRIHFPLWWTEGLAELWSGGEDARDEMILRDLVLEGRLPTLRQLGGYTGGLVYPLGGRIHRWLADTYGDWRVAVMYKELTRHESFEVAIRSVYGRSLDELDEEFQLYMRRRYYPAAESHEPIALRARRVASGAIKPAYLADSVASADSAGVPADGPAGTALYYSPATGYLTVYGKPLAHAGAKPKALLTAGRSAELENFHPFESRFDASRAPLLVFSTRYGERDALVIWHLKKRETVGRYQFPSLVSILSPAWVPGQPAIVFSGLSESGVSDLYRLDLESGELEPLTRDIYQDLDPSPSPDGTRLVFASDRTEHGLDGAVNLFELDLRSGGLRQLTLGEWVDETPIWGRDGRIYYSSSRDGVLNVFSVDSTGRGRRETSAWTGAFDPVPLPDGRGLLVGGFQDLNWHIFRYPQDSAARADTFVTTVATDVAALDGGVGVEPAFGRWTWRTDADTAGSVAADEPYRRRFTLDVAAGDVTAVPGYGGAQGAAFLMSDLLGDHMIYGSVASFQGRDLGGVLENLNVTGIYLNRAHRLNWGFGAFRVKGRAFEGDRVPAYDEEAYGGMGLVRYPLTRYSRIEGTFVFERSDRRERSGSLTDTMRVGWIASNYVTFVRDNSLWVSSGPIDGSRIALTAGLANDFTNGRFDSYLFAGDLRRYFRLGRESALATRVLGFFSAGERPRRLNIGGTLGLRGYPVFGYLLGTRAVMVNQELRFPLLRHLTFGTPIGDVRFPGIQAALFGDVGRAWYKQSVDRAWLGSYGVSFRLPVAPLAVFRLDVGRRWSSDDYAGYSLSAEQRKRSFVSFFFGYNY